MIYEYIIDIMHCKKLINRKGYTRKMIEKKSERGSIVLFVLLVCLFFVFTLTGIYVSNLNNLKIQERDISQIQENYARELNNIEEVYAELKKNQN